MAKTSKIRLSGTPYDTANKEVRAKISTIRLSGTPYDIADTEARNHISSTSNPHNVTKAQIGLENVDNIKQYSSSNPPLPCNIG